MSIVRNGKPDARTKESAETQKESLLRRNAGRSPFSRQRKEVARVSIRMDEKTNTLYADTDVLASFARTKEGAPLSAGFRLSAGDADAGGAEADVRRGVPVSAGREAEGFRFVFGGEADAVSFDGVTLTCEMQRRVRGNPAYAAPGGDPVFLARAMATAFMLSENEGCESVALRLCFIREKDGAAKCWEAMFARAVLARAFDALFERAKPFLLLEARRKSTGRAALSRLRFPYPSIREGQRDFIEELYRCARARRRLLVSAPTGIGKTMSCLYPALRAVGAGYVDRVFYFTAKTVTGNAALDAARTLGAQAPELRCIRISAKERLCPRRAAGESERGRCRRCEMLASRAGVSYEERRDRALRALLTPGGVTDSADIVRTAEEYGVCPYELSLDASEYCELIVCDYSYLLDPTVRFRRYFEERRGEEYAFLFDEAHNLPDRARETYSASLSRAQLESFAAEARAALPDDRPLSDACDAAEAMLDMLDALCAENGNAEEGPAGYLLQPSPPDFVVEALARLRAVCDEYLRRDYESAAPLFEDMRTSLRRFGEAVRNADEAFTFYAEAGDGRTSLRVMCLDPSSLLDTVMKQARVCALFSATLSPMEYYADVCGCRDAVRLELPSPYERDNLCLVTVDSVSTRFTERKRSAADVAELIETVTSAKEGNYIVYFPSYRYMESVCRQYLRLSPSCRVLMQKQNMTLAERQKFLSAFSAASRRSGGIAAFCVLGGIFSEGIDLRGESLIGTVIVGIGLPGLSSELNILADYYERTRENGRDYAYLYPAMNRILQAAGRVIRSETDRGAVVLIDDRYADPGIRRLLPPHWSRMQYTGDAYTLSVILDRFWNGSGKA